MRRPERSPCDAEKLRIESRVVSQGVRERVSPHCQALGFQCVGLLCPLCLRAHACTLILFSCASQGCGTAASPSQAQLEACLEARRAASWLRLRQVQAWDNGQGLDAVERWGQLVAALARVGP